MNANKQLAKIQYRFLSYSPFSLLFFSLFLFIPPHSSFGCPCTGEGQGRAKEPREREREDPRE